VTSPKKARKSKKDLVVDADEGPRPSQENLELFDTPTEKDTEDY